MSKHTDTSREAWLVRAVSSLHGNVFAPNGFLVPEKLRVSVGFPYGRRGGKGSHAIGQCWCSKASADGHFEVFISPELSDAGEVLAVLVHEIVHAVVGLKEKHGKTFKQCAVAVGLEGKMTATKAGAALVATLASVAEALGAYPHGALTPANAKGDGPDKQTTRMLKILCPGCGWTARASSKWIEEGLPTCHCGEQLETP